VLIQRFKTGGLGRRVIRAGGWRREVLPRRPSVEKPPEGGTTNGAFAAAVGIVSAPDGKTASSPPDGCRENPYPFKERIMSGYPGLFTNGRRGIGILPVFSG
jgi:hypothetical protein